MIQLLTTAQVEPKDNRLEILPARYEPRRVFSVLRPLRSHAEPAAGSDRDLHRLPAADYGIHRSTARCLVAKPYHLTHPRKHQTRSDEPGLAAASWPPYLAAGL